MNVFTSPPFGLLSPTTFYFRQVFPFLCSFFTVMFTVSLTWRVPCLPQSCRNFFEMRPCPDLMKFALIQSTCVFLSPPPPAQRILAQQRLLRLQFHSFSSMTHKQMMVSHDKNPLFSSPPTEPLYSILSMTDIFFMWICGNPKSGLDRWEARLPPPPTTPPP